MDFEKNQHEVVTDFLGTSSHQQDSSPKILFGSETLTNIYRNAKEFVYKHKLLEYYRVIENKSKFSLIICNCWRIDRLANGHIKTFKRSFETGRWKTSCPRKEHWPKFVTLPISYNLNGWESTINRVLDIALSHADYYRYTHDFYDKALPYQIERKHRLKRKNKIKKPMHPELLREIFRKKMMKNFNPLVMQNGVKGLYKVLFSKVINREVLSAIKAINYFETLDLSDYLWYAGNADGLIKVAKEHRNLLPMLCHIPKENWSLDELFSKHNCVENDLDKSKIKRKTGYLNGSFIKFKTNRAFNLLKKLPITAVNQWVKIYSGYDRVKTIENLAAANIQEKIPVIAWRYLIKYAFSLFSELELECNTPDTIDIQMQRCHRIFAQKCAYILQTQGYKNLKDWLKLDEFRLISDWLNHEGFVELQPTNNATWQSLMRLSNDWHERMAIKRFDENKPKYWTSAVNEITIDNVLFKALTSSQALYTEGYELHHCVASYEKSCANGFYQIFSVTEPCGTRSTLSLALNGDDWCLSQHKGHHNSQVSKLAKLAGEKLVKLYPALELNKLRTKNNLINQTLQLNLNEISQSKTKECLGLFHHSKTFMSNFDWKCESWMT